MFEKRKGLNEIVKKSYMIFFKVKVIGWEINPLVKVLVLKI